MVAIVLCSEDEHRLLRGYRPDRLVQGWTASRRSKAWRGGLHVTLVVVQRLGHTPEVAYLGQGAGGRWKGTIDREIFINRLSPPSEPLRLGELQASVPTFVKKYLKQEGCLPKRAGETLLSTLVLLRPELRPVITSLEEPNKPIRVHGASGALLTQVRDAVGIALQMAGFGKEPLADWQPPPAQEPHGSFMDRLPRGTAHEDDLVIRDAERFMGWIDLGSSQTGWRGFRKGDQRLVIGNVNRKPAEETLGVDLIYYHETRKSFVLVQYKKLTRADNDWSYYPSMDKSLASELERMGNVDSLCAKLAIANNDYRLYNNACWIKLCRSESAVPRTDELVQGMYLPTPYFEHLYKDANSPVRGSKGALRFGYKTVPRYLDNTTFGQMVADGWIGSSGATTDLIQQQVAASHAGSREIVFAALVGADPNRAQRSREQRSIPK